MNRRTILILGGALGLVVVAAAGWYLGSPLFIDRTVDEPLPLEIPDEAEMETMSESERQQVADEVQATAAAMPDDEMIEDMPEMAEALVLLEAQFMGADAFHMGAGSAKVYQLPDSGRVLRFENFSVTNGPDLHVLLATGSAVTDRDSLGEYVDLGSLKGNLGDQNYEIPADVDLGMYQSVVIYCVPFHVVFATAPFGG